MLRYLLVIPLLAACTGESLVIEESFPAAGATDVLLTEPVQIQLGRSVDASGARAIWLTRGVDTSEEILTPSVTGAPTWILNHHVPAHVQADGQTLVVTPLDRPRPGLVQDLRIVGLRQGDEETEVHLTFRTRRNPMIAVVYVPGGGQIRCDVDIDNRYEACFYGTGSASPNGTFLQSDFEEVDYREDFTYDGELLVERREIVLATGLTRNLVTIEYEGETPVRTVEDRGTMVLLDVDDNDFVTELWQLDPGDDGAPFTDDDFAMVGASAEPDARGRVVRQFGLDPGPDRLARTDDDAISFYSTFDYDPLGRVSDFRLSAAGSDGIPNTADDALVATVQPTYEATDYWFKEEVSVDEHEGFAIVTTYDRNGQLLHRDEVLPGPDGTFGTDDDTIDFRYVYAP